MSVGGFVAVVGPSGAGKDTLISGAREALAADAHYLFVRRVVTRAAGIHEDHDSVGEAEFAEIQRAGGFALTWHAHGLAYGVPIAVIRAVKEGRIVVCNLSRGAIADARRCFPRVATILVTAPDEVIASRLLARGRESAEETARRIRREAGLNAEIAADRVVSNAGTREEGGRRLVLCLQRIRTAFDDSLPAHVAR